MFLSEDSKALERCTLKSMNDDVRVEHLFPCNTPYFLVPKERGLYKSYICNASTYAFREMVVRGKECNLNGFTCFGLLLGYSTNNGTRLFNIVKSNSSYSLIEEKNVKYNLKDYINSLWVTILFTISGFVALILLTDFFTVRIYPLYMVFSILLFTCCLLLIVRNYYEALIVL